MSVGLRRTGDARLRVAQVLGRFAQGYVRVGVLDGARQHEGSDLTVGEVATIHEFGAPGADIPARSFMRLGYQNAGSGLRRLSRELAKQVAKGTMTEQQALRAMGRYLQKEIQNTFKTAGDGTWPELAEVTVRRKGHDKPLIDTHQLYESIAVEVWSRR